jgi:hypothetical protein
VSAVIFCGPTLSVQDIAPYEGFEFRPPVRQGELYAAACGSPRAIGVIDGYFDGQPAVLHKEILWALTRGIAVFGASSMGALRAAELHTFGMRGVGRIFEAFRDGELTDDDEVALIHGPPETGYIRLSEPMVNIRATLEKAVAERLIDQATGARLSASAKARFYQQRNWPDLLADIRDPMEAEKLSAWLRTGKADRKREDGLELLKEMDASSAAAPGRSSPIFISNGPRTGTMPPGETKRRSVTESPRPRRKPFSMSSGCGAIMRRCAATPCFASWPAARKMRRPAARRSKAPWLNSARNVAS